jgi:hypothetical protein
VSTGSAAAGLPKARDWHSESNAVNRKEPSPSINYILDPEDIMNQSGLG